MVVVGFVAGGSTSAYACVNNSDCGQFQICDRGCCAVGSQCGCAAGQHPSMLMQDCRHPLSCSLCPARPANTSWSNPGCNCNWHCNPGFVLDPFGMGCVAAGCPANQYMSGGRCENCPAGYTSAAGSTQLSECRISCAAGTRVTTALGQCVGIPANSGVYSIAHTVNAGNVSGSCRQTGANCHVMNCPDGYPNTPANASAASSCFVTCSANTRVASSGAACTACPANHTLAQHNVNFGSTSAACVMQSCSANWYLLNGECTYCPDGFTSPAGSVGLTSCTRPCNTNDVTGSSSVTGTLTCTAQISRSCSATSGTCTATGCVSGRFLSGGACPVCQCDTSQLCTLNCTQQPCPANATCTHGSQTGNGIRTRQNTCSGGATSNCPAWGDCTGTPPQCSITITCNAGRFWNGTSCEACPSGFPNSVAGATARTQCFSNTKSRAWTGSQTESARPVGAASCSAGTCSHPACDYVAYSNSAGTGDGTVRSGCSTNNANCARPFTSCVCNANWYAVAGPTWCTGCPSTHPSSAQGSTAQSQCFTSCSVACSCPAWNSSNCPAGSSCTCNTTSNPASGQRFHPNTSGCSVAANTCNTSTAACAPGTNAAAGVANCTNCSAGATDCGCGANGEANGSGGCRARANSFGSGTSFQACPSGFPNSVAGATAITSCFSNTKSRAWTGSQTACSLTSCSANQYSTGCAACSIAACNYVAYSNSAGTGDGTVRSGCSTNNAACQQTTNCTGCPSSHPSSSAGSTAQSQCWAACTTACSCPAWNTTNCTNCNSCACNTGSNPASGQRFHPNTSGCSAAANTCGVTLTPCSAGQVSAAGTAACSNVAAGGTTTCGCGANGEANGSGGCRARAGSFGSGTSFQSCPSTHPNSPAGTTAQSGCFSNTLSRAWTGSQTACSGPTGSVSHTCNSCSNPACNFTEFHGGAHRDGCSSNSAACQQTLNTFVCSANRFQSGNSCAGCPTGHPNSAQGSTAQSQCFSNTLSRPWTGSQTACSGPANSASRTCNSCSNPACNFTEWQNGTHRDGCSSNSAACQQTVATFVCSANFFASGSSCTACPSSHPTSAQGSTAQSQCTASCAAAATGTNGTITRVAANVNHPTTCTYTKTCNNGFHSTAHGVTDGTNSLNCASCTNTADNAATRTWNSGSTSATGCTKTITCPAGRQVSGTQGTATVTCAACSAGTQCGCPAGQEANGTGGCRNCTAGAACGCGTNAAANGSGGCRCNANFSGNGTTCTACPSSHPNSPAGSTAQSQCFSNTLSRPWTGSQTACNMSCPSGQFATGCAACSHAACNYTEFHGGAHRDGCSSNNAACTQTTTCSPCNCTTSQNCTFACTPQTCPANATCTHGTNTCSGTQARANTCSGGATSNCPNWGACTGTACSCTINITCNAGRFWNGTSCEACPTAFPNSVAGATARTQCFSNTLSRPWTGTQTTCATNTCTSGNFHNGCNSCSNPACNYTAFSNSAGTGEGALRDGCSSNSANCTQMPICSACGCTTSQPCSRDGFVQNSSTQARANTCSGGATSNCPNWGACTGGTPCNCTTSQVCTPTGCTVANGTCTWNANCGTQTRANTCTTGPTAGCPAFGACSSTGCGRTITCSAGFYQSGDACVACPSGSTSSAGSTAITQCFRACSRDGFVQDSSTQNCSSGSGSTCNTWGTCTGGTACSCTTNQTCDAGNCGAGQWRSSNAGTQTRANTCTTGPTTGCPAFGTCNPTASCQSCGCSTSQACSISGFVQNSSTQSRTDACNPTTGACTGAWGACTGGTPCNCTTSQNCTFACTPQTCPANATCTHGTNTCSGTQTRANTCTTGATTGCPSFGACTGTACSCTINITCNAGFYLNGGACVACPSSHPNSVAGATAQSQCFSNTLSRPWTGSQVNGTPPANSTCTTWGTCSLGACNYTEFHGGAHRDGCTTNSANCTRPCNGFSCNAAFFANGSACTACPTAFPNSVAGATARTQCFSNTLSRPWTGTQTPCSGPANSASHTCNSCSNPACNYTAFSNSAGTGEGTLRDGCATNNAACTQTVGPFTCNANFFASGSSCTACPTAYPNSAQGSTARTQCFSNTLSRPWTGTQTPCVAPAGAASHTCNTCSNPACSFTVFSNAAGDGDGTHRDGCSTNNAACQQTLNNFSCGAGSFADGSSCTTCPANYPNSASGATARTQCFSNTLSRAWTGSQTACSGPANSASHVCGACSNPACNYTVFSNAAGNGDGTHRDGCATNAAACTQPVNSFICSANFFANGAACTACPTGFPNSVAGATARTQCFSNTLSRPWTGTQTPCSGPANSASRTCNSCSRSACNYTAFSNSAGTGEGTLRDGCATNNAACTQTVGPFTCNANFYVNGAACTACPWNSTTAQGNVSANCACTANFPIAGGTLALTTANQTVVAGGTCLYRRTCNNGNWHASHGATNLSAANSSTQTTMTAACAVCDNPRPAGVNYSGAATANLCPWAAVVPEGQFLRVSDMTFQLCRSGESCPGGALISHVTTADTGYEACPSGTYQSGTGESTCTLCPSGFDSPEGSEALTDCARPCVNADVQWASAVTGTISCTAATGTNCTATTNTCVATGCVDGYNFEGGVCVAAMCDPGYYMEGGFCTPCLAGTFKSESSDHACTPCNDGQWSGLGAEHCTACTNAPTHGHYTGAGTNNNCPWECDNGFVYVLGNCVSICDGVTVLRVGDLAAPLTAERHTSPSLAVRINDNKVCYTPLVDGQASGALNVRLPGNQVFHAPVRAQ